MAIPQMNAAGEKTRQKTKEASASRSKTGSAGGAALFVALRKILQRHEARLVVTRNTPGDYSLDTHTKGPNGKPLFFGGVRSGRSTTSFYLMPVYVDPALLEGASETLRSRMSGKSCFSFKTTEPALFEELAALTDKAFEAWSKSGKIK